MSMQDNDDLTAAEQQLDADTQARLRLGRKAEREAAELKAQLEARDKRDEIIAAGIPDHPARDVVFASYDGPRDANSLREYAEKMGIMAAGTPSDQGGDGGSDADRRILDASSGRPAATSSDVDAAVAMRNAKSASEVMEIVGELAGTPGFKSRDGLVGVLPEPV